MKNNKTTPLQIALYGMDERTYKMMSQYLQGPCKGMAIVVDESQSDIDLLDADHIKAKELLDQLQAKKPSKPLIVLSLEELHLEGTIYVKKPVETQELIAALKQAQKEPCRWG